jgi:hypothetical protein
VTSAIQSASKASCAPPRKATSAATEPASVNRPDLRTVMAAGIAMSARISPTPASVPADLSGRPASTVHSALACTSTPGIGTGETDVVNMLSTGSVTPMSTALPVKASAGIRPTITSENE